MSPLNKSRFAILPSAERFWQTARCEEIRTMLAGMMAAFAPSVELRTNNLISDKAAASALPIAEVRRLQVARLDDIEDNVILLSLACRIVVAYAPVARDALKRGMIDGVSNLAIGILSTRAGVAIVRLLNILWRVFDKPIDWFDSPYCEQRTLSSTISPMCHLVALEAVGGRIANFWRARTSLMVAADVFVGALPVVSNLD